MLPYQLHLGGERKGRERSERGKVDCNESETRNKSLNDKLTPPLLVAASSTATTSSTILGNGAPLRWTSPSSLWSREP